MNTEHEIQLSDDLRHIVAGQSFEADIDTIARSGRRVLRRSIAIRGVAGLGVLALAAGGVLIGLHAGTQSATATAPGTSTGAPQVETAAYVVKQAQAALDRETDYVIQEDTNNFGSKYTLWTDPRTGNTYLLRGSGASKQEAWGSTYLVDNVMHWKTTEAHYDTRTWFVLDQHAAGPIEGAPPSGPYGGAGGSTSQIKHWLSSGIFQIVGHGDGNGHQVTKLRRPWAHGYLEVWVDSRTYQPVHVIIADFANESGPMRNGQMVIDESWIPRSADRVDLTNHPRIPAGFTQVAPPK